MDNAVSPPVQRILRTDPVDGEIHGLAWLEIPLIFGMDYLRKKIAERVLNRSHRQSGN